MRAMRPAHGVKKRVVVGQRGLLLSGIRSKAKSTELQAVHIRVGVCGRQVDPHLSTGNGRFVIQFVADDVDPGAELVDQTIAEDVSLGDAAKAAVQRNLKRKVQIGGTRQPSGLNSK